MTKQEIARRIADIEGVKGIEATMFIESLISVMDGKNSVLQIGKAFLWDLMIKHDIDNSRAGIRTETGEAVYCAKKHDSNAELVFSRSRDKVILLAILAANRSLTA